MTDRHIDFRAPMVRALLEGRKTQHRSILKPQPGADGIYTDIKSAKRALKIVSGDRLWVREAIWSKHDTDSDGYNTIDCGPYLAGGKEFCPGWDYVATPGCLNPPTTKRTGKFEPFEGEAIPGDWWFAPPDDWNGKDDDHDARGRWEFAPWGSLFTKHPSIHMPRWASRLTLTVTDVRVERLQEISEADAIAEGVRRHRDHCFVMPGSKYDEASLCHSRAEIAFAVSWDELHGPDSWAANPYVAATTFTVEFRNIDEGKA